FRIESCDGISLIHRRGQMGFRASGYGPDTSVRSDQPQLRQASPHQPRGDGWREPRADAALPAVRDAVAEFGVTGKPPHIVRRLFQIRFGPTQARVVVEIFTLAHGYQLVGHEAAVLA